MELYLGTKIDPDDVRENDMPVSLGGDDVFRGGFIGGQSGTGKTGLFETLASELTLQGVSFIYIEPAGFSSRNVYSITDGECELCSLDYPYGLNPLRQPYRPNDIVEIVVESMNEVMRLTVGDAVRMLSPNMKNILTVVIPECLAEKRYSLLDVRQKISRINHHLDAKDGLLARLDNLLSDPRMNQILCGEETIDIGKLSASGRPLIVNCEQMSAAQMVFVGNIVTMSLYNFLRYAKHDTLYPLVLLMDEAHNFCSESILPVIKEGRKYQLAVFYATQDLAFFTDKMRRVVLNSGMVATYTVAHFEAAILAKELLTTAEAIQSLEKFCFLAKTPSFRGMVRAPYPPVIIPHPLPAPVTSTAPTAMPVAVIPVVKATNYSPIKPKTMIHWFPIQPLPPPATTTPEAAPVEAH